MRVMLDVVRQGCHIASADSCGPTPAPPRPRFHSSVPSSTPRESSVTKRAWRRRIRHRRESSVTKRNETKRTTRDETERGVAAVAWRRKRPAVTGWANRRFRHRRFTRGGTGSPMELRHGRFTRGGTGSPMELRHGRFTRARRGPGGPGGRTLRRGRAPDPKCDVTLIVFIHQPSITRGVSIGRAATQLHPSVDRGSIVDLDS